MRLFNVDTDEKEIYRITNAMQRLSLMLRLGRYNDEIVYGKASSWKSKRALNMLEVYEARLKELRHGQ